MVDKRESAKRYISIATSSTSYFLLLTCYCTLAYLRTYCSAAHWGSQLTVSNDQNYALRATHVSQSAQGSASNSSPPSSSGFFLWW